MGATSAMCSTVRTWTRSCGPCGSSRLAGRTPFSASNNWTNAWEEGASVAMARCTCPRAPPPRPWPSSGAVRCGATSRPGPSRRSSAHVSAMSGAVARAAAARRCRMQPKAAASHYHVKDPRKQGRSWVKQLVVVVVLVVVVEEG